MSDSEEVNDISVRHRKERKELQAKIQSLKKSAAKGDKKKRKEVLEEIAQLEIDIDKRQSDELNDLNNAKSIEKLSVVDVTTTAIVTGDEEEEEPNHHRVSKAQKRRDKKAREEKERDAEILAQEELNKSGPRMQEALRITKLLRDRNLSLHGIQSDGDCLYNAVRHQLEQTERGHFEVTHLRNETANYILENKDTLLFYMTNPSTGDILTDEEFEKYCEAIRNTPAWGGQIELKALSHVCKVPIEVIQATGPPTIQGAEEFAQPNLTITYHRHMYSLGEHYNSTKPFVGDEDSDEAAVVEK